MGKSVTKMRDSTGEENDEPTQQRAHTHIQAKSKAKPDVSVGTKEENSNVQNNGREQPRRNLTSRERKLKHHRMKKQRKIPQEKSNEKQEQRKSN